VDLYAAPQNAQAELHWKPRFTDIDAIVRTAWAWHERHPQGYGARPTQ
jgi:UDP-glucose 4-epimerase